MVKPDHGNPTNTGWQCAAGFKMGHLRLRADLIKGDTEDAFGHGGDPETALRIFGQGVWRFSQWDLHRTRFRFSGIDDPSYAFLIREIDPPRVTPRLNEIACVQRIAEESFDRSVRLQQADA